MKKYRPYQQYALSCLCYLALSAMVYAGAWNTVPQPLIVGPAGPDRKVATADAGSSLVMDSGWRCLYSVNWNQVMLNYWTGKYFKQISLSSKFYSKSGKLLDEASSIRCSVAKDSALVVDQAWHMLFYISADHGLVSAYRTGTRWKVSTINSNATHLLGVDQTWHIVYAYDSVQRSILALRWDKKLKQWISESIVKDIGTPGGEGVVDSGWHVLYSCHSDAPSLEDRGIVDHANTFGLFNQWPLVATYWDGEKWRCQLVDKTALPQRPSVRTVDHRLFYAKRDNLNQSCSSQPPANPFTSTKNALGKPVTLLTHLIPQDAKESVGVKDLDQEIDNFVDDQSYRIDWNPNYAKGWLTPNRGYGYFGTVSNTSNRDIIQPVNVPVYNSANLTPVVCYIPEWTSEVIPPRIKSYRSAMDQRRGDLVHQTAKADSGLAYQAINWVAVSNVYKRAIGSYVRLSTSIEEATSMVWNFNPTSNSFVYERINGAALLDSAFGTLEKAVRNRFATLDSSAPLPASFLSPRASAITTMGHSMNAQPFSLMLGRRYQNYSEEQEEQSDVGGVATDPASSFVFYTQAPTPNRTIYRANTNETDSAPRAAKNSAPSGQVWIVVIF